jgi:hypothetical protein
VIPGPVSRLICGVRQINGMLQILDAEKNNPSITLGEIHELFKSKYGIDPADKLFAFCNQYQYSISLFAFICILKEEFFNELDKIHLKDRSDIILEDWGIESLQHIKSLGELVRYLRNSIVHNNLKITPELNFEFGDKKNKVNTIIFNHENLEKFCAKLTLWCLTKDVNSDGFIEPLAAENFIKK